MTLNRRLGLNLFIMRHQNQHSCITRQLFFSFQIRILVVILLIENVRCQDGFSDRDILRLQQMASNNGQIDTSYTNLIQRDPSSQTISSVSVQYHMTDDAEKNEEYNRADRGRSRKVYRIKNPFQHQLEDERQPESNSPQDSDAGASNQYASMQYSLPPEEFLQQMRAENQYYQQQQQVSTQAPNLGYTATPQPQYLYSTIAASGYDSGNQQNNQVQQLEPKISQSETYRSIANPYSQYSPNSYGYEGVQSTPSPASSYLSTPLPNAQYVGTPTNTYVSSSQPIFLSSQPNMQAYVSSSITAIQAGTPDYNNKVTTTIGSNSLNYDSNDQNKKIQLEHYDNSGNGIRYPTNQQYQNEYPSSTMSPSSTPYSDMMRDSWQNNMNSINAAPKSLQETSLQQYQRNPYNRNPQDGRSDQNSENINSDTHRIGNVPSANNVYLNFVQPDYQALSNIRTRTRDLEQETGQPDFYSHGEYGWKLSDKRPLVSHSSSSYSSSNYPRYQQLNSQSDGVAVSQMSFHMDTGKPNGYDQISKSSSDTEAQEFAKAAAKAHENLKRQQQFYGNDYLSNNGNNPQQYSSNNGNNYYGYEKPRSKVFADISSSSPYQYNNAQQDLITASPYYYQSSRENLLDEKSKLPFDHDKALKNIVPIDVSNVVPNSESQQKLGTLLDNSNKYNVPSYSKDLAEQNLRQNFKTITDSFYQDKNAIYGFNIKPKPDEVSSDALKFLDQNVQQYYSRQPQDQLYNQATYHENKRLADGSSPPSSYIPKTSNGYQDSVQSSANIQQQGLQQRQPNQLPTDITSILKLNDIPYRLTQNSPTESYRFYNNNYEQVGLPTPLPMRINQNVGSHQLDVANDILNKLILNKQPGLTVNRPEIDQSGSLLSNINGFKVANPFNVDLKLVADMLKGKPAIDDSQLLGLRDQFNKPSPLKLDISQLQQYLLKNENNGNIAPFNDGIGAYSSPYLDIFNSGRYPYQGVKYSRSQEEEESISVPIADASNTHPIGAVMEQDDAVNVRESTGSELTAQDDDSLSSLVNSFAEDRPKSTYNSGHDSGDRHRHPNSLLPGRYSYSRKYPKSDVGEPYPLLKPPPPHSSVRSRGHNHKVDKHTHSRRRRVKRPRMVRVLKTEPLFEAESEEREESRVPTLLRPPPPNAEAKSDKYSDE